MRLPCEIFENFVEFLASLYRGVALIFGSVLLLRFVKRDIFFSKGEAKNWIPNFFSVSLKKRRLYAG